MTSTGPFFDKDKAQISDALAVSQRIQAMQAPPPGSQSPAQPHAAPSTYQIPAGAPNPGARFGAPPMGPPDQQQQPMASRFGGGQVGVQVPQGGVNINLGPSGAVQGAGVNANVGKFDISAALNNALQLQNLQARYNPGGPFSASANYAPDQGVGGVQYQNGPLSVGGGYDPRRGAYADLGVRTSFQEGGLATSLPGGYETRQSDLQFMNDRYNQMHEVAGKYHSARGGPAVRPV